MKIDKPGKPLPASPITDILSRASKGRESITSAPSQSSGAKVSLGSTATRLHSMESSMASAPVVDQNKVAEIKRALSEGRFQVNSGVVADNLLKTVKELISNR